MPAKAPASPAARGVFAMLVVLGALGGATATTHAQQSLPATAPTGSSAVPIGISPSQLPSANPPVRQAGPVRGPGEQVLWDGRTLLLRADNSSLNDLLRQIAGKAHLHITGTAPEERIFGTYGPGRLVDVLSDLLAGAPVNVLLAQPATTAQGELVLTPRSGGGAAALAASGANPLVPTPAAPAETEQTRSARQVAAPGASAGRTDPQPDQNAPAAAATPDGQPASPNGVKTPQEIFDQLQRLRSQAGGR